MRPKRTPTRPRTMMAQMACRPARASATNDETEKRRVRGEGPSIAVKLCGVLLLGLRVCLVFGLRAPSESAVWVLWDIA